MSCLGVFFALSEAEEKKVLAASSDEALIELIQEDIEGRWDTAWLADVDKAWDAMQRCLGDGTLDPGTGVLSRVVLGGRQLHQGGGYIVSYLSPAEVKSAASALAEVEKPWLVARYQTLADTDYDGPHDADDCEYTWENLVEARKLFLEAAKAGRAVIFTVDQ